MELVPRSGSSFIVWKYFGCRASNVSQVILCLCRKAAQVPYWKHITNCRIINAWRLRKNNAMAASKNFPTSTQTFVKISQCNAFVCVSVCLTKTRWNQKSSHINLTKDMRVKTKQNRVSNVGFWKMINIWGQKSRYPQRNYFSKVVIPALYAKRCRGNGKWSHSCRALGTPSFIHIHDTGVKNFTFCWNICLQRCFN